MENVMLCKAGIEKQADWLNGKWIAQRKLDGCRCVITKENGRITLIGRNLNDLTFLFPDVVGQILEIADDNFELDGEIECQTFNELQHRIHLNKLDFMAVRKYPAKFWAFDILSLAGRNLKQLPLIERMRILNKINVNQLVVDKNIIKLLQTAKEQNWEGIVIKNPYSKYELGRSRNWLKIKLTKEIDLEVKDFTTNNREISALVTEKGNVNFGVPLSVYNAFKKPIMNHEPLIIKVNYQGETAEGKLRCPILKEITLK